MTMPYKQPCPLIMPSASIIGVHDSTALYEYISLWYHHHIYMHAVLIKQIANVFCSVVSSRRKGLGTLRDFIDLAHHHVTACAPIQAYSKKYMTAELAEPRIGADVPRHFEFPPEDWVWEPDSAICCSYMKFFAITSP